MRDFFSGKQGCLASQSSAVDRGRKEVRFVFSDDMRVRKNTAAIHGNACIFVRAWAQAPSCISTDAGFFLVSLDYLPPAEYSMKKGV